MTLTGPATMTPDPAKPSRRPRAPEPQETRDGRAISVTLVVLAAWGALALMLCNLPSGGRSSAGVTLGSLVLFAAIPSALGAGAITRANEIPINGVIFGLLLGTCLPPVLLASIMIMEAVF